MKILFIALSTVLTMSFSTAFGHCTFTEAVSVIQGKTSGKNAFVGTEIVNGATTRNVRYLPGGTIKNQYAIGLSKTFERVVVRYELLSNQGNSPKWYDFITYFNFDTDSCQVVGVGGTECRLVDTLDKDLLKFCQ